jgi:hypothetical protein
MYPTMASAKVRTFKAFRHSIFMLSKGDELGFALEKIHLHSSWKLYNATLTSLIGIREQVIL